MNNILKIVSIYASLIFFIGCSSTSGIQNDGVSTYILAQRIERLEKRLNELNINDSISRHELNTLINEQENKITKEIDSKLANFEIRASRNNFYNNDRKQVTKEIVSENIVWITMKNGSRKPIVLRKDGNVWIGPLNEIYNNLPDEEQLKILYTI